MNKASNRSVTAIALAIIAILILPSSAIAADASEDSRSARSISESRKDQVMQSVAIGFDVVVLRPLAIATLVVGAVLLVPAALLAAPGGKEPIQSAVGLFVTVPYAEAFERPLGDF